MTGKIHPLRNEQKPKTECCEIIMCLWAQSVQYLAQVVMFMGGGGLNGWQVEGGDKRKDGECRGRGEGVQGKQAIKEGPEDFILISANPGLLNYMSVLKLTKINCVNQQGFTSVFHPQHRILQKDFRCFFYSTLVLVTYNIDEHLKRWNPWS